MEYGFGVAVFHTSDVEPDRADGRAEGIRGWIDRWAGPTSTTPDDWGAISAWAWAASRILDYLETDAAVAADRVCVVGHSRGGKTALWAAAQDSRFAAAISNESGCAGAALSRCQFGERIGRIGSVFPYWFCTAFRQYAEREPELPVDQHQLLALLAPRPLYVASAGDDLWADPRGEYLALVAAAPAFHWAGTEALDSPQMPALGAAVARGRTAYHVRPGPHDLTEGDWSRFAEFVGANLSTRAWSPLCLRVPLALPVWWGDAFCQRHTGKASGTQPLILAVTKTPVAGKPGNIPARAAIAKLEA